MTGPLRGLLFAVAVTVLVVGLPFAFVSRVTLGAWILCGVVPVLWCLGHPADRGDARPGYPADARRRTEVAQLRNHLDGEE